MLAASECENSMAVTELDVEYIINTRRESDDFDLDSDEYYEAVWGGDYYGYENSLNVHIRHLREKVEQQPSQPRWILTARGLGYRLAKEESQ